jgi:hypothetical protein
VLHHVRTSKLTALTASSVRVREALHQHERGTSVRGHGRAHAARQARGEGRWRARTSRRFNTTAACGTPRQEPACCPRVLGHARQPAYPGSAACTKNSAPAALAPRAHGSVGCVVRREVFGAVGRIGEVRPRPVGVGSTCPARDGSCPGRRRLHAVPPADARMAGGRHAWDGEGDCRCDPSQMAGG